MFWLDREHRAAAFPSHYRPALRVILAALDLSEATFTTVPVRSAPPRPEIHALRPGDVRKT